MIGNFVVFEMAAESTNKVTGIPLFDGTNFNNWKFRVEMALDERGLGQFIERKLRSLLDEAKNEKEREKVTKSEKQCKNIIVQSVHDCQLENIKDKETAKDMIDGLAKIYERKSIAGQLLLKRQLLTMKYSESDDMTEHLLNFDKRIRELKSAGANMENLDIVVHLLITLPKGYENLVVAIETKDQDKVTLDFVKSRLLDEFNKKRGNGKSVSTAMNANITCYRCGQVGHTKFKCKARGKNNKSKKPSEKKNDSEKSSANTTESKSEAISMCAFTENTSTVGEKEETAAVASNNAKRIKFVLDSGATEHMANDESFFSKLIEIDNVNISVAKKNASICANKRGNINVKTMNGDCDTKQIKDVLFVKDLKFNLMSIRSLTKRGFRIVFQDDVAEVTKDGRKIFAARALDRLYEVDFQIERSEFAGVIGEHFSNKSQFAWNFRLCHLNVADMKKLVDKNMVLGIEKLHINVNDKFCESCVLGKQTRLPFPSKNGTRSNRILQLIHSDVCGPIAIPAYDGSKYFVTFTDDFSRASTVFCIERKSDVFSKFKEYVSMSESLHGCAIAKLKADNGGEYISAEMKRFCTEKGIQLEYTVPYNPEMNSIAERLNRTLVEKARSILCASGIDKKFWSEAIYTANYIKNRSPTTAFGEQFANKTPNYFKTKPNLSNLRIFGATCFNHIPAEKRSKLDVKSSKCIMLGYATNGSYRLWDVNANKLVIGRNVVFNENSVLKRHNLGEESNSEAVINSSDDSTAAVDDDVRDQQNNISNDHGVNLENIGCAKDTFHGVNSDNIGNNNDPRYSV